MSLSEGRQPRRNVSSDVVDSRSTPRRVTSDTQRPTVLHVTHNMAIGGAEQVIAELVAGSETLRVDCEILCIDGTVGSIGASLREQGVPVHSFTRSPGLDRALIRALRQLINDRGIDLVHCHQYTPFCYGALATPFSGARLVFTEHGRLHPDSWSWKRRLVNPLLARCASRSIAISEATRDALVAFEWFPRRRINVVYNGIAELAAPREDIRRTLDIPEEAFVCGTISRLDPIKNQSMMLDAVARLHRAGTSCVLILAGDGPERKALEARAHTLGIEAQVRFPGFIDDRAGYLEAVDVFLLTSFSEGTSMTLLEAMSRSKPIIATAVGGTVELIDSGRTGLLVESSDAKSLSEAIGRLADDPDLRARLGAAARVEFDTRFTARRMFDAYARVYHG